MATVTVSLRGDRFQLGLDNARLMRGRYDGARRVWTLTLSERVAEMARRAGDHGWVVVSSSVDIEEYVKAMIQKPESCARCGAEIAEAAAAHCAECGAGRNGQPDRAPIRVIDWESGEQVAGSYRADAWADVWVDQYRLRGEVTVTAETEKLVQRDIAERNSAWTYSGGTRVAQPIRKWTFDAATRSIFVERVSMLTD